MEDIGEVSQRKGRWSTWRGGAVPAGRGKGGALVVVAGVRPPRSRLGLRSGGGHRSGMGGGAGGWAGQSQREGGRAGVAGVQPPHGRLGRRSGGGCRSRRSPTLP